MDVMTTPAPRETPDPRVLETRASCYALPCSAVDRLPDRAVDLSLLVLTNEAVREQASVIGRQPLGARVSEHRIVRQLCPLEPRPGALACRRAGA